jgi:hypothetical protein
LAKRRLLATAALTGPEKVTRKELNSVWGINKDVGTWIKKRSKSADADLPSPNVITEALHREKRKDAFGEEKRSGVINFIHDNSTSTANKRDLLVWRKSKGGDGKTKQQKRVVTQSLRCLHRRFCEEKYKISLAKFLEFVPFYVVKASEVDRKTCCCRYCVDFDWAWQASDANLLKCGFTPLQLNHASDFADATLCFPVTMDCRLRKCKKPQPCSAKKIRDILPDLSTLDASVKFQWKKMDIDENDHMAVVIKTGTPEEFLQHLILLLEDICLHKWLANHQREQMKAIATNLPRRTVIIHTDFSEKLCMKEWLEAQV